MSIITKQNCLELIDIIFDPATDKDDEQMAKTTLIDFLEPSILERKYPDDSPNGFAKTPREVIINALAQLADDLGQFEQTTHVSTGPFNFIRLGDELASAYRTPDSYNISCLSQMCRGIVKELTQQ